MHWDLSNISFSRATLQTSIIVANHNTENTIGKCIDSLQKQTYPNLDIVIVDDASEDNSVNIIKKYAKKDKRIKLIELSKNIGAYGCRNIGLESSKGFFVSLLDADDIFLSKKIELDVYNYFNNNEYDIFFSNMYRCQNIDLNKFNTDDEIKNAIDNERSSYLLENDDYIYGHNAPWEYKFRFGLPTIFLEKSFFDKYGLWNQEYRYGMDLELIQRYIVKKYNEFVDHKKLWEMIYLYQAQKYGIFLSDTTNYVSFPQNNNNATNVCLSEDRDRIHAKCNSKLKKLVNNNTKKLKTNNSIEIFCMIKNEEDILEQFIEYYLNITDQITIVDNGSTDSSLSIAKKYPINLISNPSDFKNKALIISDLMKNSKADLLIPVDVDEFLFLEQKDSKIFDSSRIKKYLGALNLHPGDKLQIKNIYEYYPDKLYYWDINNNNTKMMFAKSGFMIVDTGYHKGTTSTNNIIKTDISYCHFHFRSKDKWIQNTKQKLYARLGDNFDNMSALKAYTGDSRHCVEEWIRYVETGRWHNLQPRVKFRLPNRMQFD
jgi:glycosyltransferase involved in cell wall biosynthesis